MPDWIDQALAPYMKRVQARPGRNGLSRSMNQVLRSHPESVEIIRRAVTRLIELELLTDLSGEVRFTRQGLYVTLVQSEGDWLKLTAKVERLDSLVDPTPALNHFIETGEIVSSPIGPEDTTVVFVSDPCYKLRVFSDAMGIAKRVRLIAGYGKFGLHPALLARLRILRKQRIPEPPMLADDLGQIEGVNP
jgi:hypothetical protein